MEEGRIAYDGIIGEIGLLTEVLKGGVEHFDARGKGRTTDVLSRLSDSRLVDVNSINHRLWETLGQHESDEPRACADVEETRSCCSMLWQRCPGTEERAIGAHLHSATVLLYGELTKGEAVVAHRFRKASARWRSAGVSMPMVSCLVMPTRMR